jgi:hypothetical protein
VPWLVAILGGTHQSSLDGTYTLLKTENDQNRQSNRQTHSHTQANTRTHNPDLAGIQSNGFLWVELPIGLPPRRCFKLQGGGEVA